MSRTRATPLGGPAYALTYPPRRTPLAWCNLRHDRAKSLIAIAGVGFALTVIFMQSGFLQSVLRTATIVTDKLDFDVILVSRNYLYFAEPGSFPRTRLAQASAVAGVGRVMPFSIGTSVWRNNRPPSGVAGDAQLRPVMVLGFDLADHPFRPHGPFRSRDVEDAVPLLSAADAVLVDRRSRKEFGPLEVGLRPEIGARHYRVVGLFAMGTGFAADGAILVGEQTYRRICGPESDREANLGLIKVEPGANPRSVARALARALPPEDVRVMTRAHFRQREMAYWIISRSIGTMFVIGVSVAFLVGAVVAYQVLSSDVADHLGEYATLRAIGYTGGQLARVVLEQGLIVAIAAYVPALLLSWYLYTLVETYAVIPIDMHLYIAAPILGAALAMCSVSALGSLRTVRTADPADVFGP